MDRPIDSRLLLYVITLPRSTTSRAQQRRDCSSRLVRWLTTFATWRSESSICYLFGPAAALG
jgi:hypothetical protein